MRQLRQIADVLVHRAVAIEEDRRPQPARRRGGRGSLMGSGAALVTGGGEHLRGRDAAHAQVPERALPQHTRAAPDVVAGNPRRRAVEAGPERRRVVLVGRAEDGDDRRADGAGQVHRPGVVGDDGVGPLEHGRERGQVGAADQIDQRGQRRAAAVEPPQRVTQLGAGHGVAAGADDHGGEAALAPQRAAASAANDAGGHCLARP